VDCALHLSLGNLEFNPGGFVVQPLRDKACEAQFFEFQIAAGHELTLMRTQFSRKCVLNVTGDKCFPVAHVQEFGVAANAVRRSGPDGMEHRVEQQSALRRREARLCWLPVLSGEAGCGESLEGALRLRSEDSSATRDFARWEGKRLKSWNVTVSGSSQAGATKSGASSFASPAIWTISLEGRASAVSFCFA